MNKECEDCKGTGWLMTVGVILERPRYGKKENRLAIPYYTGDKWQETQCHCVGE